MNVDVQGAGLSPLNADSLKAMNADTPRVPLNVVDSPQVPLNGDNPWALLNNNP